ncbi:hypothetical protein BH23BAC1_BH23BAC1_45060 [soil metagenome]
MKIMYLKFFTLLIGYLILFFSIHDKALAQQSPVSGIVTSDDGPLPGANVVVKGTTTGTISDVNGNFSLNVPSLEDVLIFSYIGMVSQEVPINGRTNINIRLETDLIWNSC